MAWPRRVSGRGPTPSSSRWWAARGLHLRHQNRARALGRVVHVVARAGSIRGHHALHQHRHLLAVKHATAVGVSEKEGRSSRLQYQRPLGVGTVRVAQHQRRQCATTERERPRGSQRCSPTKCCRAQQHGHGPVGPRRASPGGVDAQKICCWGVPSRGCRVGYPKYS